MIEFNVEDIISPGDRVDLIPKVDSDENIEDKFYITKVYDIDEDGRVEIFMPMEKLRTVLLSQGSEFEMFVYASKGIFTCDVYVYERYKTDALVIAVLELDTPLKKRQRREYYRYGCVIGMNTRQLTEAETTAFIEKKDTRILKDPNDKSVAVDISGGGLRFVSNATYENGSLIMCRYMLTIQNESKVYDSVIRLLSSSPVSNNTRNTEYRGQFLFMSDNDREQVIKYIFEEERKLRHRS